MSNEFKAWLDSLPYSPTPEEAWQAGRAALTAQQVPPLPPLPPLPAPAHRITGKLGHLVSFESTTVSKGDAILTVAEADAYARAAVQAEREACAKACESQGRHAGDGLTFYTATGQCVAAIRARSTK